MTETIQALQSDADIDFTDRTTQACPFAAYAAINGQGGIYLDKSTGFYIVTGYDLVKRLARDNRELSNQSGLIGVRREPWQDELDAIYAERGVELRDVLVSADPPEHNFQRSLIDKVFNPARVGRMTDYLEGIIDKYIDAFPDHGEVDFHSAVSLMVPMTVIADQLGVPHSAEDMGMFKRWSDAVVLRSEPGVPRENQIQYANDICDLQQFIMKTADECRATPNDTLLSDLVHADVNGRMLTIEELVSMVIIILVAGNETTTSAISSGMERLLTEPGLQARLRADPALIPAFVEEVLRIDAPLQGLFRRAVIDMEIGGMQVPANAILVLKWGGANHDCKRFSNPEEFDLERPNLTQHLTFGSGPHFCVGNQLARSEIRLVFEHMLIRTSDIRAAKRPDQSVRQPHYTTFGFRQLWIELDKA
jgi:cytochrome P450